MTIAIIGAGMSGAACANQLMQQKMPVAVFDKGRAPGGRMSSKRTSDGYADLGAQYFTARSESFAAQCQQWQAEQVITCWQPRIAVFDDVLQASADAIKRYIGLPSMQKPVQQLLQSVDVKTQCLVDKVQRADGQWQLYSNSIWLGNFSRLVLAVPQQQAMALLQHLFTDFARWSELFDTPALLPCWAVNITLSASVVTPYDAVFVRKHAAVSWIARQNSKGGRGEQESWLVHFSPVFSKAHLNASEDFIAEVALLELQKILAQPLQITSSLCHRWRYAQQSDEYTPPGSVWLPELNLGLCGDWLAGGRVENAWLSGKQLAGAMQL
ncbi:MAG TPA: FAD-dependent oxidoreductase [Rheinheimera sp.]|nr:FAD-dependent oxidoreductase [Rheinheimera sp.]